MHDFRKQNRKLIVLIAELKKSLKELRESAVWRGRLCPDHRPDNAPGYSQGEARYWHELAGKSKADADKLADDAEVQRERIYQLEDEICRLRGPGAR